MNLKEGLILLFTHNFLVDWVTKEASYRGALFVGRKGKQLVAF